MRKLIVALLVLLASVAAALWLHRQGGFVLVTFGPWSLQTSVLVFVLALLATLFAVYALVAFVRELLGLPGMFQRWAVRRREGRTRAHLLDGLIRLAEGRYGEAEKLLLKDVERSEAPLLHYLAAAIIAQRQGSHERRDHYLGLADRTSSKARLAVGLIQAQLQIEAQQWEQALATLNYLYDHQPHQPRLLSMLAKCCEALKEWERLEQILPELRKQGALPPERLNALTATVARHRLENAGRDSLPALERVWDALPRESKDDPELLLGYCQGLAQQGEEEEAERLLRARLQKEWNVKLLQRYGALKAVPADKTFAQLEKWLRERPDDPALLYAAARQGLRAKLWGRARSYLEAAASRAPRPETYHLLGALLEQMGERDAAHRHYRKALELVTGGEPWAGLGLKEAPALTGPARDER